MSGSQFAPDALEVIDLGTAPEIYVDGLALYSEENGIIRSVFYSNQPVVGGSDEGRMSRIVSLRLLYTHQAQERMRRALLHYLTKTEHPFKVDMTLMRS